MSVRLVLAACLLTTSVWAQNGLFGFGQEAGQRHQALEDTYSDAIEPDNLRKWMQEMTTRPHHAGSPKAKENAEFIASLFESWGFDTRIETFHVLFPTPQIRRLELEQPFVFEASLEENLFGDAETVDAIRKEGLPPFNAYSADGLVTGELVYVNQGLPADYEELERRGIDVRGKIVLARYGGSWRGIKPKVAAEKGAIGCLIFNDPEADGYTQGAGFPDGAFKHSTAVQRGSVMDMPLRAGDPLTPGRGATKNAKRLAVDDSDTIMKIPVLPISQADAEPLLRALDGPVAPAEWRGALPVTYRLGGGGATKITLETKFNWDLVPAYNVVAVMHGGEFPDQWIVRGNHHDAWVIGARDPISGLVTVLEQARVFSELAKTGWQPKRSIVFCAWDAEEPALLGSVEWVEEHSKELTEKAVAYVNTDGNSRGFLYIGGSHTLETMAAEVAKTIDDPETGVSLAERWRANVFANGTPEQQKRAKSQEDIWLYPLGSGSDYSGFLQHLGIACFNVSFGGHGRGGEYHTAFDTFEHYTRFVDPDFAYGAALVDVCGRLTLRLADAEVLPFDFKSAAAEIRRYADEIMKLADDKRTEVETFNEAVENNYFQLANDPEEPFVAPEKKVPVPHFNFAPLQNAVDRLDESIERYNELRLALLNGEIALPAADWVELNEVIYGSERAFLNPEGLPRRPWFRHMIYAPGFYTGYGVKTLPGIREGIEEEQYGEAQEQVFTTAAAIERFADAVDAAGEILDRNQ